jgi:hypothetical protein
VQLRNEQADHKGNPPERDADLEQSDGVDRHGLGLFGAHRDKSRARRLGEGSWSSEQPQFLD